MGIQLDIQGRVMVATLEGELDHHQAERLRPQLDTAFENSPCKHLVLDMGEVSFMDSSGIGMIIGRYKNAEKRGGQLTLACMNSSLAKLFEFSGLQKIVHSTATVSDAIAKMEGGK
ncbi:MAG: anti-sigma factor antagonist [Defluviitaleaceae bacterium]|nr:anti-sigma factor antagonist [Defluviitaleaceae bacterium]